MLHLGVMDEDQFAVPRCGGTGTGDIVTFDKSRVTCDFCRMLNHADNSSETPTTLLGFPIMVKTAIGGALPFHKHAMNATGTRLCDMTPERARLHHFTAAEIKEIDCTHCLEIVNSWRPWRPK